MATPGKLKDQTFIPKALSGESLQEIASIWNTSPAAVHQNICKHFNGLNWGSFKDFRANKDKWFEAVQFRLLSLITDDVATKMVERRGSTDIAILEDKIRLIRGQSTENIDVHASYETLEDTKQRKEQIKKLLLDKGIDIDIVSKKELPESGRTHDEG